MNAWHFLPSENEIERAMELSLALGRALQDVAFGDQPGKAMFGIVQGGDNAGAARAFRRRRCPSMGLKGYAVGGLAVGEPQDCDAGDARHRRCPELPAEKPRYLMGVGTPDDIVKSVARGIDMFDCVMPTRSGRHGLAFTRRGRVNIRNARHAEDMRPLDEQSNCPASRDYSRAYLHHLVRSNEALGGMLLSWHNLAYYQELMQGIRKSIEEGRFPDFYAETIEMWAKGDIDPV